jgi:hypothetical protein
MDPNYNPALPDPTPILRSYTTRVRKDATYSIVLNVVAQAGRPNPVLDSLFSPGIDCSSRRTKLIRSAPHLTKRETVLGMMKRPGGAFLSQIRRATGWKPNTIRAFVSTVAKKEHVRILSKKTRMGERLYQILPPV